MLSYGSPYIHDDDEPVKRPSSIGRGDYFAMVQDMASSVGRGTTDRTKAKVLKGIRRELKRMNRLLSRITE